MNDQSPSNTPVVPSDASGQIGYAQALGELERILAELEASDVDVDTLATKVARATELITLCRERIGAARLRIDQVIADLDGAAVVGDATDN